MVDIVVLSWNTLDVVSETLFALLDYTSDFRVVALDNGSEDGSYEWLEDFGSGGMIQGKHPMVLLRNEKNVGYTKGVNQCLRVSLESAPEAIVLLNSDAYVTPGWKEAMLSAMEPDVGIVCPKVLSINEIGYIESAGDTWIVPRPWYGYQNVSHEGLSIEEPFILSRNCCAHRAGWEQLNDWDKREDIDVAAFAVVMLNPKMVREIGLLDEQFIIYFSDTEYSMRAKRAGWRVVYEPAARIYHLGSETAKRGLQADTKEYNQLLETDAGKFMTLYHLAKPEIVKKFPWTAADPANL